jgi:hypothetical protein
MRLEWMPRLSRQSHGRIDRALDRRLPIEAILFPDGQPLPHAAGKVDLSKAG